MKRTLILAAALLAACPLTCFGQSNHSDTTMKQNPNLTREWDKVFPQSDRVNHSKVTFRNRYGITLAADLYIPRNASGKLPAIAVSGPFGAVKEQASGLYAQTLAERGFLTVVFDPSYTGESGGEPRYVASPDINTEDFSAAVDFLSTRDDVDPERIGILGICDSADSQSTRRRSTRGSRRRWLPRCTTSAAARRTDISTRWMPTHATNSAGSSTPSARKTQGQAPARWPAG